MGTPTDDPVGGEEPDEVVLRATDGWTLRCGLEYTGAYFRLCQPDGSEWRVWHKPELDANPDGINEMTAIFFDHCRGVVPDGDDTP